MWPPALPPRAFVPTDAVPVLLWRCAAPTGLATRAIHTSALSHGIAYTFPGVEQATVQDLR